MQLFCPQRHFILLRNIGLIFHAHDGAGFAASDFKDQLTGSFNRLLLQSRIYTTLEAMRRIGVQAMRASTTCKHQWCKESTLKKNIFCFCTDSTGFATHDSGER